jgi:hypothetical protein
MNFSVFVSAVSTVSTPFGALSSFFTLTIELFFQFFEATAKVYFLTRLAKFFNNNDTNFRKSDSLMFSTFASDMVRMHLQQLSLVNFKNFGEATVEFSPKINIITGQNGIGKTNLLDAIITSA